MLLILKSLYLAAINNIIQLLAGGERDDRLRSLPAFVQQLRNAVDRPSQFINEAIAAFDHAINLTLELNAASSSAYVNADAGNKDKKLVADFNAAGAEAKARSANLGGPANDAFNDVSPIYFRNSGP